MDYDKLGDIPLEQEEDEAGRRERVERSKRRQAFIELISTEEAGLFLFEEMVHFTTDEVVAVEVKISFDAEDGGKTKTLATPIRKHSPWRQALVTLLLFPLRFSFPEIAG